jgi:hypothetical protein
MRVIILAVLLAILVVCMARFRPQFEKNDNDYATRRQPNRIELLSADPVTEYDRIQCKVKCYNKYHEQKSNAYNGCYYTCVRDVCRSKCGFSNVCRARC